MPGLFLGVPACPGTLAPEQQFQELLRLLNHVVNGKFDIIIAEMRESAFWRHEAGFALKPDDRVLIEQVHPLGDPLHPGLFIADLR